ncbi:unknown [Anaerotruncus sp. CAG:390]|nr:unknown [Anaerotruncus sp. CAG:390]
MTDVGHVAFLIGGIFGLGNDAVGEFDAVFVVSVILAGDDEHTVGYHKRALFKEDIAHLDAVGVVNALRVEELVDLGYHIDLALT